MNTLVASNDLAGDVTGAEALIERHQEHRAEIDARTSTFDNFDAFGHELLENKHYASPEIQERIEATRVARDNLLK